MNGFWTIVRNVTGDSNIYFNGTTVESYETLHRGPVCYFGKLMNAMELYQFNKIRDEYFNALESSEGETAND